MARSIVVSAFCLGALHAAGCGESHPDHPNGSAGIAADGGKGGSRAESGKGSGDPEAGRASGAGRGAAGMSSAGRGAAGMSSAGRGAAGMSSMDTPIDTTFAIRNEGDNALLLGSSCGGSWFDLKDHGKQLGVGGSCSCPCDDRSVCGCPPACLNTQQLLVPGTTVSLPWDGVAFDYSTDPSCYVKRVPRSGDMLTATGCWNFDDNGKPAGCNAVEFAYGKDTLITISANGGAPRSTVTKVGLTNTTGAPIEVVTDRCGVQAWFELDMGPRISLNTFCTCTCAEGFKRTNCPVCGGCAEDVLETVAPGQTISLEWDGGFDYSYESSCSKRYTMPAGTRVQGKFCWGKPAQSAPVCVTSYFNIGESSNLSAF